MQDGRRNPIIKPAETGAITIRFPSSHPLARFKDTYDAKDYLPRLGILGETVDFAQLPTTAQPIEMAEHVGAISSDSAGGAEACGSPGEVANEPNLGHIFPMYATEQVGGIDELYEGHPQRHTKSMVWSAAALEGEDQLRQRAAWALAQILVVSQDGIGSPKYALVGRRRRRRASPPTSLSPPLRPAARSEAELYVTFYDIFTRHAFGNYEDVLREVAYSPPMATMLSYLRNKGYVAGGAYPDENFAREVTHPSDRHL